VNVIGAHKKEKKKRGKLVPFVDMHKMQMTRIARIMNIIFCCCNKLTVHSIGTSCPYSLDPFPIARIHLGFQHR
jgi:hypothetical protein